jgi:hypothetical protein
MWSAAAQAQTPDIKYTPGTMIALKRVFQFFAVAPYVAAQGKFPPAWTAEEEKLGSHPNVAPGRFSDFFSCGLDQILWGKMVLFFIERTPKGAPAGHLAAPGFETSKDHGLDLVLGCLRSARISEISILKRRWDLRADRGSSGAWRCAAPAIN